MYTHRLIDSAWWPECAFVILSRAEQRTGRTGSQNCWSCWRKPAAGTRVWEWSRVQEVRLSLGNWEDWWQFILLWPCSYINPIHSLRLILFKATSGHFYSENYAAQDFLSELQLASISKFSLWTLAYFRMCGMHNKRRFLGSCEGVHALPVTRLSMPNWGYSFPNFTSLGHFG